MRFSLILVVLAACSSVETTTLWVNSFKVACEGEASTSCLQIQINQYEPGQWQTFHGSIEGFTYQAGYIYELEAIREEIPDPPADASSFQWKLVREVTRTADPLLRINDIWALTHMEGKEYVVAEGGRNPVLEFQVAQNRFAGNAFCNGMQGQMELLTEEQVTFGLFAMTKMLCSSQDMEDRYVKLLGDVVNYDIKEMQLMLSDSLENELLRYKKID